MIGLGSNRLSVCRRGGMSVTQAGRGGMEWLGVRYPSWATPYSAQATAALLAQFPTQWPTIRDYGFAHPALVPFINEDPMMVMSLIDGLGVRYLITDGASWIDTGIKDIDGTYTAKFKYKSSFSVGTRIDNTWQTNRSYRIGNSTPTSTRADWPIGNTTQNLSWSEAPSYEMEVRKGLLKVNGTTIYSGSVSSAVCPDYTYYVFAMNNFGSVSGCYEGQQFAYHELVRNGVSLQNLVPFVSTTRNGMLDIHDLENPVFYPNAGTGTFTTSETPS